MTFSPNIYSIVLIVCGLITLYMCIKIFRRYEIVVRWFGFMMLGIAIWALSYGFELSSTTLAQMMFWINLEYLGISFLPACWFLFIIKFTGKDKWLSKRNLTLVLLFPLITLLLVWTNELHHLHYKSVSVDDSGPFPLLSIVTGPWYTIHTIYFYIMLGWGVLLLINKFRKADPVFRKQNLTILIAAFIPWIANISYLFGYRLFGHIDITPFFFTITVLLLSIGLIRFRLLDIIPIARERVLDAMIEGLIVADNQDRIIDLNTEIKKILSINDSKIIGKKLEFILPNQPELYGLINDRKGGVTQLDLQKDGVEIYLEVTISTLFDNTIYSGVIILFRDITHRVHIEKQLRLQSSQLLALNKLKDKLFSIIAHDLRSPLLNLIDIIKMIDDDLISEQEFKSFIPQLSKNIGYTSGLLENLLFWSKSQLRGEVIRPVSFDIKEVTENIIHLFEKRINEKEILLINNINCQSMVYADQDMIQLIVRNLISNAVKFSQRGGNIVLSSHYDEHYTTLCFKDDGVGVSETDMNKLFEFETFTTRGTDNEQGTGLGLVLCKDFIEKNGGQIWVESELSMGSKFCVKIPNSVKNIAVLACGQVKIE